MSNSCQEGSIIIHIIQTHLRALLSVHRIIIHTRTDLSPSIHPDLGIIKDVRVIFLNLSILEVEVHSMLGSDLVDLHSMSGCFYSLEGLVDLFFKFICSIIVKCESLECGSVQPLVGYILPCSPLHLHE